MDHCTQRGDRCGFHYFGAAVFSRKKAAETGCSLYMRGSGNDEDFWGLYQQLGFGSRNRKAY